MLSKIYDLGLVRKPKFGAIYGYIYGQKTRLRPV
jgi:hypothetical protein